MTGIGDNRLDPLEECKSEHRALVVLRMLLREPSYMSNEEIVRCQYDRLGLSCTRTHLREGLATLAEAGLIETSMVDSVTVIRLTAKGEEAAKGIIVVEGVLKPGVDCLY